jgi:hypothetical protein
VLTLDGERISAITWFFNTSVFPHLGLPRTLPENSGTPPAHRAK